MSTRDSEGRVAGRTLPAGYEGPRACGPMDLAGTLDLANLVLRTLGTPVGAVLRRPTIGYDYTHIYHPGNLDNIRVILAHGEVVCSVAIYPTVVRAPRGEIRVGGINAVVTHPEHRRHGLASAAMEDAAQKMRADGLHIGLLGTGIPDWYRKLGWETAGCQYRFTCDRGNIGFLPEPADLDVSEDWRSCVDALHALYRAERLGAVRSPEIFRLLMERKLGRVFVARRGGAIVAYAGVGGTQVREYAGAAEDVAALLRALFAHLDDTTAATSERAPGQRSTIEMSVLTPEMRDGLPGLLAGRGIPVALSYQGMIRILDAPGLLAALGVPELELTAMEGGWQVRHGGKALAVTERELVKLLFGPERFPGFADGLCPLDFYQWPLDRV